MIEHQSDYEPMWFSQDDYSPEEQAHDASIIVILPDIEEKPF